MAEKSLTESDWKNFAKSLKLDNAKTASKEGLAVHEAVLEALQDLGKKDEDRHADMLSALDKLEAVLNKQVVANAKRKEPDLKDVKDQLHKMLAALEKQRKTVRAAKDAKDAADREAAEEEDSPALLTTKMVPLLREVRKGELVLQALIGVSGKEAVVLLSRRAISPARGKLLKEQMSNPGGLKLIRSECLFEANTLTFVVEAGAAGLAKKIKAALLAQTEMRMKVRVRGLDPTDVDEDLDDADAPDATAGTTTPADTAPAAAQNDELRLAYEKKLALLEPRVSEALSQQIGDVGKIRAVSQFAQGKAEAGEYKAALQALQALEALLPQPAGSPPGTEAADPLAAFKTRLSALLPTLKGAIEAGTPGVEAQRVRVAEASALANKKLFDEAAALLGQVEAWLAGERGGSVGGIVALQKSRKAWADFRQSLQSQLDSISRDVLDTVQDNNEDEDADEDYDEAEVRAGLDRLKALLESLDVRLIDKLDAALNASGTDRDRLQKEAKAIVGEYQSFVSGNGLIAAIDDNGFVDTSIRREADQTLRELAAQL